MSESIPYDYEARFIYGEKTRCALISLKGKARYIGPFVDHQNAIDEAKVWLRARGWTGGELRSRDGVI